MTTPDRRLPDPSFWQDRPVLVTGHTGFKGSWLTTWLDRLGARVAGLSLEEPPSVPSLWSELSVQPALEIRGDVSGDGWQDVVTEFDPHVVIHLAAQPLVAQGYADPLGTFTTNVLGTAKVLASAARLTSLKAVLVATTDKVYDTTYTPPYGEDVPLSGHDPYAASKVAAELVTRSWPGLHVPAVTARAGNVIGGGDWGRHRLIPDLVRAWSSGATPELRQPDAVRPWQHVLEPLSGYLIYIEGVVADPALERSMNFGPTDAQAVAVRDVAQRTAEAWATARGCAPPEFTLAQETTMRETHILEIDSTRAADRLGWRSTLGWRDAVDLTVQWYAEHQNGRDATELVHEQLDRFAGNGGR